MKLTCKTIFLSAVAGLMVSTSGLMAEEFEARSTISGVTLYPEGAKVRRAASVSLPAGNHEILIRDIPYAYDLAQLTASLNARVAGARLGPVTTATYEPSETERYAAPAVAAAKQALDDAYANLAVQEDERALLEIEIDAAEDALDYLARLKAGEGATIEERASLAQLIAAQSAQARRTIIETAAKLRQGDSALQQLEEAVGKAEARLAKLASEDASYMELSLSVSLESASNVSVELDYITPAAAWRPSYTAELDTEAETLVLSRGVQAVQSTGEAWVDVPLAFSTDSLRRPTSPGYVGERVRRFFDPQQVEKTMRSLEGSFSAPVSEAAMADAAFAPRQAEAQMSGLSLTYIYDTPATLYSSDQGATEFVLSEIDLDPELFVRANLLSDGTGFVMARFENTSDETLIPGDMRLIRDGASLQSTALNTLVPGQELELAFGAIDGIQIDHIILDRSEGDRGVLSKSNASEQQERFVIENLTARSWPIEALGRVSVSEQEDLDVQWNASPMPTEENYDNRRGVLAWRFELPAAQSKVIELSETLKWPEGQTLR